MGNGNDKTVSRREFLDLGLKTMAYATPVVATIVMNAPPAFSGVGDGKWGGGGVGGDGKQTAGMSGTAGNTDGLKRLLDNRNTQREAAAGTGKQGSGEGTGNVRLDNRAKIRTGESTSAARENMGANASKGGPLERRPSALGSGPSTSNNQNGQGQNGQNQQQQQQRKQGDKSTDTSSNGASLLSSANKKADGSSSNSNGNGNSTSPKPVNGDTTIRVIGQDGAGGFSSGGAIINGEGIGNSQQSTGLSGVPDNGTPDNGTGLQTNTGDNSNSLFGGLFGGLF